MFKKNTAVVGFGIGQFINASTGATVTTGTPTCKRTIDGTGGACANAAAYNSDGAVWEIDLDAADMNGDVIILSFSLTDCLPIAYTIHTVTGVPDASGYFPADAVAISGNTTAANNAELAFDGTGYGFTNCTVPTVTTLTGHTAQTGDSYAYLGTNLGALGANATEAGGTGDQLTAIPDMATATNQLPNTGRAWEYYRNYPITANLATMFDESATGLVTVLTVPGATQKLTIDFSGTDAVRTINNPKGKLAIFGLFMQNPAFLPQPSEYFEVQFLTSADAVVVSAKITYGDLSGTSGTADVKLYTDDDATGFTASPVVKYATAHIGIYLEVHADIDAGTANMVLSHKNTTDYSDGVLAKDGRYWDTSIGFSGVIAKCRIYAPAQALRVVDIIDFAIVERPWMIVGDSNGEQLRKSFCMIDGTVNALGTGVPVLSHSTPGGLASSLTPDVIESLTATTNAERVIFGPIGTNDYATTGSASEATINQNINKALDRLYKLGLDVVVCTIPPRGSTSFPATARNADTKAAVLRTNTLLKNLATRYQFGLLDLHDILYDSDVGSDLYDNTLTADGIHIKDFVGMAVVGTEAVGRNPERWSGRAIDSYRVRTAVGLDSANLDTQLAVILEDTGTTIPAQITALDGSTFDSIPDMATATALTTIAGYLDTEIAAILADTNELQTDWANGGRLDVILDSASAPTAAAVADAVLDELLSEHVVSGSLSATVSALSSLSGEGAYTGTLTVNDGSTGLEGVVVNARRGGVLKASGTTDANGQITNWVFGAYTYDLALRIAGYQPKTDTITVSADAWTKTVSLTAISVTAPDAATLCTVQFRVKLSDTAVQGAICKAKLQGVNQASDGTILSTEELSDTTDSQGVAELQLVQKGAIVKGNGVYKIWVEIAGQSIASVETKIPNQGTYLFEDLI